MYMYMYRYIVYINVQVCNVLLADTGNYQITIHSLKLV